MKKTPLASLIISNYNGKDILKECLESLFKQNYPYYEIIVVDAGSIDGATQMVRTYFPEVKLIELGRRIGIGEAINIGIRKANGELIGFDLNNDEVFSKDWLRILVNVLLSDKRIGVVGGTRLIYGTNETIDDAGVITNSFGFDFKLDRGRRLSEIPKCPREVSFTTTLLFSRDLLEQIGFCDEVFYIYFEDADFCERVRRKNYKVISVPQAISYHRISSTVGKQSPKSLYFLIRGRIRFIIKHYSIDRMLAALVWWIILQTVINASMIIPVVKNIFSITPLEFIAKRGTMDHLISMMQAITWNVKNLKTTIRARRAMQVISHSAPTFSPSGN